MLATFASVRSLALVCDNGLVGICNSFESTLASVVVQGLGQLMGGAALAYFSSEDVCALIPTFLYLQPQFPFSTHTLRRPI